MIEVKERTERVSQSHLGYVPGLHRKINSKIELSALTLQSVFSPKFFLEAIGPCLSVADTDNFQFILAVTQSPSVWSHPMARERQEGAVLTQIATWAPRSHHKFRVLFPPFPYIWSRTGGYVKVNFILSLFLYLIGNRMFGCARARNTDTTGVYGFTWGSWALVLTPAINSISLRFPHPNTPVRFLFVNTHTTHRHTPLQTSAARSIHWVRNRTCWHSPL